MSDKRNPEAVLANVEALIAPGWHTNRGYEYDTTLEAYAAGRNDLLDKLRELVGTDRNETVTPMPGYVAGLKAAAEVIRFEIAANWSEPRLRQTRDLLEGLAQAIEILGGGLPQHSESLNPSTPPTPLGLLTEKLTLVSELRPGHLAYLNNTLVTVTEFDAATGEVKAVDSHGVESVEHLPLTSSVVVCVPVDCTQEIRDQNDA